MPYWAPSENGTQCHTCSREPLARGSRFPAQPGISSLVRRGASRGSFMRYFTLPMTTPPQAGAHLLTRGRTSCWPERFLVESGGSGKWLNLTFRDAAVISFRIVLNHPKVVP